MPPLAILSSVPAVYRMHPPGSWFHPCQWWEVECRRRLYRQRVAGRADMT
jgi:hypothetical protein